MKASIVIDAPRPTVWFTLLRFGSYPDWMEGVHEVRKVGEDTLHWRATVAGHEVEWEAEIVALEDDELLEWHARGSGPAQAAAGNGIDLFVRRGRAGGRPEGRRPPALSGA